MRKVIYEKFNPISQSIKSVDNINTPENGVLYKGHAFNGNKCPVEMGKKMTIRQEFINFMTTYNLMLIENDDLFFDKDYKKICYEVVQRKMEEYGLYTKFTDENINKFIKSLGHKPGFDSFGNRKDIPEYRPRRRYLEFSDCIYDTFDLIQYKKNTILHENKNQFDIQVHPCYKFDKSFMFYSRFIPHEYFNQVAKLMEPEMFEWYFEQFTQQITPTDNVSILSYPHKLDDIGIFKPFVNMYNNVLYNVNSINKATFDIANCARHDIIYTEGLNPLASFNKNKIFTPDNIIPMIEGKETSVTRKYKQPETSKEKIIISVTNSKFVYIPDWLSENILSIELPKNTVKLDPNEFIDENVHHIGGFIIANMMTNRDEIKDYIKQMRYDNKWNVEIKVHGKTWPDYESHEYVQKPVNKKFNRDNISKYQELNHPKKNNFINLIFYSIE